MITRWCAASHAPVPKMDPSASVIKGEALGLIVSELRDEILDGRLRPGERIHQEAVAERFGTSRLPVREALRQLQHEGLVVVLPNAGARVVRLDQAELGEVYLLRERLEPLAIERSAPGLSTADQLSRDSPRGEPGWSRTIPEGREAEWLSHDRDLPHGELRGRATCRGSLDDHREPLERRRAVPARLPERPLRLSRADAPRAPAAGRRARAARRRGRRARARDAHPADAARARRASRRSSTREVRGRHRRHVHRSRRRGRRRDAAPVQEPDDAGRSGSSGVLDVLGVAAGVLGADLLGARLGLHPRHDARDQRGADGSHGADGVPHDRGASGRSALPRRRPHGRVQLHPAVSGALRPARADLRGARARSARRATS